MSLKALDKIRLVASSASRAYLLEKKKQKTKQSYSGDQQFTCCTCAVVSHSYLFLDH